MNLKRRKFLKQVAAAGASTLAPGNLSMPALANENSSALLAATETVPQAIKEIKNGIDAGWHIGAQLYISRSGTPLVDYATGLSRPSGTEMTPETMMTWFSCTKPLTAICIAQCWERGLIHLDDPVAKHIPAFGQNGKESVTIRHVLTHTAGFPFADMKSRFGDDYDAITAAINEAPLEPGWEPGKAARYHPTSGWHILGAIITAVDGRLFSQYIREELFLPLGMTRCWVGMPAEQIDAYGEGLGEMVDIVDGEPMRANLLGGDIAWRNWWQRAMPGANGVGPMRELGRFYECMLGRGELDGARVVMPQTVEAFTAVHRLEVPDYESGKPSPPWGLGFKISHGIGYPYASPRTFGHAGSASSMGFVDPEHELVVAAVFNGRTPSKNGVRFKKLNAAIYEDLGLKV